MSTIEERAKMFLFARWISTCYADTKMDKNGKSEYEKGFVTEGALSVLNMTKGAWWKGKIHYFDTEVMPNYIKNGSFADAVKFLGK